MFGYLETFKEMTKDSSRPAQFTLDEVGLLASKDQMLFYFTFSDRWWRWDLSVTRHVQGFLADNGDNRGERLAQCYHAADGGRFELTTLRLNA